MPCSPGPAMNGCRRSSDDVPVMRAHWRQRAEQIRECISTSTSIPERMGDSEMDWTIVTDSLARLGRLTVYAVGQVILVVTVGVVLTKIADRWPELAGTCQLAIFLTFCISIYRMIVRSIQEDLRDHRQLTHFVETYLFSDRHWSQRYAMGHLSIVVGARFGAPPIMPGKFRRALALWRSWWRINGAVLRWDPMLRVYTEHGEIEDLSD